MSKPEVSPEARGYPEGFAPSWWRCPKCGDRFHDSQDRHRNDVAWDMDPECGACGVTMKKDDALLAHIAGLEARAEGEAVAWRMQVDGEDRWFYFAAHEEVRKAAREEVDRGAHVVVTEPLYRHPPTTEGET